MALRSASGFRRPLRSLTRKTKMRTDEANREIHDLSLIHISEPTRLGMISYAVFCLKKKKKQNMVKNKGPQRQNKSAKIWPC